MTRLNGIQRVLKGHHSTNLQELEKTLEKELEEVILQEEILWKQKSICNWISLRDRNTKYFYSQMVSRRNKNKIRMLKDGNDD